MFAVTQPWQKDGDYKKLVQGLEPPPAPGTEGAWELHFCKWWGWNWVQRGEMETNLARTSCMKPVESKKPEKKPIKNLCQTLCFKKKKDQQPLQKMYNTPSNSVIHDFNNKETSVKSSSNTVSGSIGDPSKQKKKLYRPSSNSCGCEVAEEESKISQSSKKKGRESSSSEECCCFCSNLKKAGSGDSIEFINITCCPCCHSKEQAGPLSSKKNSDEKYTQGTQCRSQCRSQCKMMSTQTEGKKRKKRRICLVCCCKCGQNMPPSCCPCSATKEDKEERIIDNPYSDKYIKFDTTPKATTDEEATNVYTAFINNTPKDTSTLLKKNYEPPCIAGMPIDTMLYFNKHLPKYEMPSRSYSWIHATKSEMWDQFSHLKLNRDCTSPASKKLHTINKKSNIWDKLADIRGNNKFSSPLSGKTYNISPIKIEDLKPKSSVLLNPLNVDEELANLKQIESDVKMDLKSRIMLDAVCDAILNKEPQDSPSMFLSEFTYPLSSRQTECTKDTLKSVPVQFTSSKHSETNLDTTIFEKPRDQLCVSKMVHDERNTKNINMILNKLEHDSIRDYSGTSPQSTPAVENHLASIFNDSLKETSNPFNWIDYRIKNNQYWISPAKPPLDSTTKLMPTAKRSASPITRYRDNKKVKLQKRPGLSSLNNSNISDIFRKIDEIVTRSKINNNEIQNVLHNIPKRPFHFFTTSWETSNMTNSNPPLHPLREGNSSNSSFTTEREEIRDAKYENFNNNHDKTTLLQHRAGARPSLIPKRCAYSKCVRRNVN